MIRKLDRYIIRKFLTTYFFMLGVIMLLAMVFDLAERLSDFIDKNATVYEIIFDYYLNFLIYYGNLFASMIVFISVIWFTAKMAQEAEIIPMLFSGRPFTRILRPYMVAATILMLLSLVMNHVVLPRSNRIRLDFEENHYRERLSVQNFHAEFPGNEIVHYSSYSSDEGVATDFIIEKFDNTNRLIYYLKARGSSPDKKQAGLWHMTDVFERHITYNDSLANAKNEMDRKFIRNVIKERHKLDTVLSYHIDDLAQRENVAEVMTYTELTNFIQREKEKGNPNVPSYEIELYQRTSYPFATYVLTLMGVSVSSRKKRGGIGINIAIGLLFVFIYIFAMKITTVAALKVGFPPIAAVWTPNVLFGILSLVMYRLAPK